METAERKTTLWDMLERVPDHRDASGRRFSLRGILGITLAATLAGRDSLAAIARWGRKLTRRQLAAFGIDRKKALCHATYHNVFKGLEIMALERELGAWTCGLALGNNDALAIDGKTLRASRTEDDPGVHLLAAFSRTVGGVVGQVRVPDETNEIKAAIRKLDAPDVDVVITELGGTVGDIESLPFLEAVRQLRSDLGRENTLYVHLDRKSDV